MAAIDMTRTATLAPVVNNVVSFFTGLVDTLITWNDARVSRKALNGLTDRELDDIGLVRGDIDSVAFK